MDFSLADEPGDGSFLHRVGLVDRLTGRVFSNKLQFVYLEVPKFVKKQEDLETKFDKWMYVLKNLEFLERLPEVIQEKIFAKVMDIAELVNMDNKERKDYEESLKNYRDLKNALDSSEEKGFEMGKQVGVEETKRLDVINFYKEGASLEMISRAMRMDIEKVKGILKDVI
ncbi:PD-(D/E)XK nuclease family transposase [Lunatibacter salilacus]|uniref:PD-(D/E)XK nuclease family transposase n=1 Tax=Lunatibacter salilacus TaxID=2483804 RepID=UPI00131C9D94|nr:PD-(D/E)XK nuclease family transposase [Lunatibacter salilacus]